MARKFLGEHEIKRIKQLRRHHGPIAIARMFSVSKQTVFRHLRSEPKEKRPKTQFHRAAKRDKVPKGFFNVFAHENWLV